MDLGQARKVFFDGFLRHRDAYQMELPLVPLGELYGTRLETWLDEHDVEVRLTTGVRSVEIDEEGGIEGVVLRSSETVPADFVVLSVPFDRVASLLGPEGLGRVPSLDRIDQFRASPITGVHLWFDRPVCPYDHAVTVGRTIQWVFNHTAIQGRVAASDGGQYLQIVISASYELVDRSKDEILKIVRDELAAIWPAAAEARLERSWVVTEHGATFSVRPGIDAIRPRPAHPDRRPLPRRRLDKHRLARHDGRGRPQRLPRRRRHPRRPRPPRPAAPPRPSERPPLPPPTRRERLTPLRRASTNT